jgi:hypothetical protein
MGTLAGAAAEGTPFGDMGALNEMREHAPTPNPLHGDQPQDAAAMPDVALGFWIGMEQDEEKAKQLRTRGASLLTRVRSEDPNNRLGFAPDIDLLLMQNAMIDERHDEANALAQRYVEQNPKGEGVALAYIVQALGSLPEGEQEGPPDLSKVKALLEKAIEGPGDDGSKMLAGLMRVMFEIFDALMKGFVEAFEGMGKQMQEGVKPK